jgi:hypothetical protein
VPDWATISSLATAGGTLVLAVATFASVRSGNRSARIAEQALSVGLRPLLVPSRLDDVQQKIFFGDGKVVRAVGGSAVVELEDVVVYLAISLRNAGSGIAVLHGWRVVPQRQYDEQHPELDVFRQHARDIFVPPNDIGFWQGAIRDRQDPDHDGVLKAIEAGDPLTVDVLYGDYEGGQRAISRFLLRHGSEGRHWLVSVTQHWNVDRPDPR